MVVSPEASPNAGDMLTQVACELYHFVHLSLKYLKLVNQLHSHKGKVTDTDCHISVKSHTSIVLV